MLFRREEARERERERPRSLLLSGAREEYIHFELLYTYGNKYTIGISVSQRFLERQRERERRKREREREREDGFKVCGEYSVVW